MVLAVCLDNNGGMSFGNRRQSRDIAVYRDLMDWCKDGLLYITEYSKPLFDEARENRGEINVVKAFSDVYLPEDACAFLECVEPSTLPPSFLDKISKIVIYKWNRVYPSDMQFDIDMSEWSLHSMTEFAGKSHEKITREVYTRA